MSGPDFSVVIPTYQRSEALRRCLGALKSLDPASPSFEVIVVDDGGTAPLDEVLAPFRAPTVRLLRQAHAGPAAARNTGVAAARGRWLAFTDDDCAPAPGWLSGFARRFADGPELGLGGRTVNRRGANTLCAAHQLLVDHVCQAHGPGGPRFYPSNNLALPAGAFRDLGGFDTSFPFAAGEDRDLCVRWLASGRSLSEAPEAIVEHGHALGLAGFCRMHHRYGRGARRFHHQLAERSRDRVRWEPAVFYAKLLLAPLSRGPLFRAPPLCAALVLSQLCHAAGYAWERRHEGRG